MYIGIISKLYKLVIQTHKIFSTNFVSIDLYNWLFGKLNEFTCIYPFLSSFFFFLESIHRGISLFTVRSNSKKKKYSNLPIIQFCELQSASCQILIPLPFFILIFLTTFALFSYFSPTSYKNYIFCNIFRHSTHIKRSGCEYEFKFLLFVYSFNKF